MQRKPLPHSPSPRPPAGTTCLPSRVQYAHSRKTRLGTIEQKQQIEGAFYPAFSHVLTHVRPSVYCVCRGRAESWTAWVMPPFCLLSTNCRRKTPKCSFNKKIYMKESKLNFAATPLKQCTPCLLAWYRNAVPVPLCGAWNSSLVCLRLTITLFPSTSFHFSCVQPPCAPLSQSTCPAQD